MESTLHLHQVLQVRNLVLNTSVTSPRNRLFRNHPSLPDDRDRICLHLETWAKVLAEPIDTMDSQRSRIDKLLNFFINVATLNDLATTPAVQSLQEAVSVVRRGGDFSRDCKTIPWQVRVSQLSVATKTNYQRILNLRNLCIHGIPLFNIWDSMSFIYTVCAEDLKTQLGAELHLYQFRMIIAAFHACEYFHGYAKPTTVAASWTEETQNQPLNIAFATTCVGPRKIKQHPAREDMAAARQEFMKTVTDKLTTISTIVNNRKAPNRPGNCPEYLTWPIVCTQEGRYKSLCFTMAEPSPMVYQCCAHCERTLQHLGANNIQIDDLWQTSSMSVGEIIVR